jgi:hypothetical protein
MTDGHEDSSVQKVIASSVSVSFANFSVSVHMSLLTLFLYEVVRKSFHQSSHGVFVLFHLMADNGESKRMSQKAMAWSRAACLEVPVLLIVKVYLYTRSKSSRFTGSSDLRFLMYAFCFSTVSQLVQVSTKITQTRKDTTYFRSCQPFTKPSRVNSPIAGA